MFCQNKCHICFLPEMGKDCVKLIRYKNNVYKFAVRYSEELHTILQAYGDVTVQREFENVLIHTLNTYERDEGESTMYTPIFGIRINYPWQLCTEVCFKATDGVVYYAAKQQFVLTFILKSFDESRSLNSKSETSFELKKSASSQSLNSEFQKTVKLLTDNEIYEDIEKKNQSLIQREERRLKNFLSVSETTSEQSCGQTGNFENGVFVRFFRCLFRL